jgi:aryl-alcohol dehydrogenase-like predicted oxidoreductase
MSTQIGATNFRTGKLALGCVTFGREIGEEESYRIMDYAVEHGITLFDTAESYGDGSSEKVIGRWLRRTGCRNQIVLQTKVSSDSTRAGVARSTEASLDRLQTGCVDFYLLHRFDTATPLEETPSIRSARQSSPARSPPRDAVISAWINCGAPRKSRASSDCRASK